MLYFSRNTTEYGFDGAKQAKTAKTNCKLIVNNFLEKGIYLQKKGRCDIINVKRALAFIRSVLMMVSCMPNIIFVETGMR